MIDQPLDPRSRMDVAEARVRDYPASMYYIERLRNDWSRNVKHRFSRIMFRTMEAYMTMTMFNLRYFDIITALYLPTDMEVRVELWSGDGHRGTLMVKNYHRMSLENILSQANSVPVEPLPPLLNVDGLRGVLGKCNGEDLGPICGPRRMVFMGRSYERFDDFYPCYHPGSRRHFMKCSCECPIGVEGWVLVTNMGLADVAVDDDDDDDDDEGEDTSGTFFFTTDDAYYECPMHYYLDGPPAIPETPLLQKETTSILGNTAGDVDCCR